MTKLKAYCVTEEFEGRCTIVFADRAASARRKGAAELDDSDEDVSCRREPKMDHLAPGPATAKDYLDIGYTHSCSCGCDRQLSYDDEPVFYKGAAYCSRWGPLNEAEWMATNRYHKRMAETVARLDMPKWLTPVGEGFRTSSGYGQDYRELYGMKFTFPGASYGGGHWTHDGSLYVANGDKDSFTAYRDQQLAQA